MPLVDDVAILLGKPMDHRAILAVVRAEGLEDPFEHEPGHPEDGRYDYCVPSLGLQLMARADRIIVAIFFMIEGDENTAAYPWRLANGIGPSNGRDAVRARLGTPESSGPESHSFGGQPYGPWDRFPYPPFGLLHVQYKAAGDGIAQMTLMHESARR